MRFNIRIQTLTIFLIISILAGLFLRLYHVGHSLGAHPDERHIVMTTMALEERAFNPKSFAYGSLPFYLLYGVSKASGVIYPWLGSYDGLFYVGRILLGLPLFLITVFFLIKLSKEAFEAKEPGVFASMLLAGNYFHIQLSRFYTVDPLLLCVVVVSLYCAVRTFKFPSYKNFILFGITLGLAYSVKTSGLSLLAPLGFIVLVRFLIKMNQRSLVQTSAALTTALATALLVLFLTSPFFFLDSKSFIKDQREQVTMVRGEWKPPYTRQYDETTPYLYHIEQMLNYTIGLEVAPFIVLGLCIGLYRLVRYKNYVDGIVLVWLAGIFIASAGQFVKFPRYLLPMYPILFLYAGVFLFEIQKRLLPISKNIFLLFLFVLSFFRGASILEIITKPHTYEEGSQWMYANIPKSSKVISVHWDDRLPIGLPGFSSEMFEYQKDLPLYEVDNELKIESISRALENVDYIIFPTQRLPGSIMQAYKNYPMTSKFFAALYLKKLGFEPVYNLKRNPTFLGVSIDDDAADESLSVYDHPQVTVFKKVHPMNNNEIKSQILSQDSLIMRERILNFFD